MLLVQLADLPARIDRLCGRPGLSGAHCLRTGAIGLLLEPSEERANARGIAVCDRIIQQKLSDTASKGIKPQ
jgi:hypothetical protein